MTFTPCSPRHGAKCSPAHAEMVAAYRDQRAAYELQREAATMNYPTELAEYAQTNPGQPFSAHVSQWAGATRDPEAPTSAEVKRERKAWNRALADAARAVSVDAYREVIADWEFAQVLRDSGETVADALATITRKPLARVS